MLGAIKYDGEIHCIKLKNISEDYLQVGGMFNDLELHQYGIIVRVGDGEYKILEE